tara:strand:+ start:238 stop:633 length:396 start_codon:yes stop_codon:yes gene_type:complete
MGTLPTRFYYNNDDNDDNKEILNKQSSKIYYKYDVSIKDSSLDYIKKNIKYNLYLCENDIILQNAFNKYIFIYQNINYWIFSINTFGLFFKNTNVNECDKKFILFNVNNGKEVANNLKVITKELVEYYKKI